jgi:hypothetical protein
LKKISGIKAVQATLARGTNASFTGFIAFFTRAISEVLVGLKRAVQQTSIYTCIVN